MVPKEISPDVTQLTVFGGIMSDPMSLAGGGPPLHEKEERMVEIAQWRHWITKLQRQSAQSDAQGRDFTTILMFSLSGLALSFFAIGQGGLGDADYLAKLVLMLQ
jgi:hypothetical protein